MDSLTGNFAPFPRCAAARANLRRSPHARGQLHISPSLFIDKASSTLGIALSARKARRELYFQPASIWLRLYAIRY